VLAYLGLALLLVRMGPLLLRRRPAPLAAAPDPLPPVTVVVPARNEARRLPGLLASLARLDHPEVEVVVVDDYSDDGTAEVARRHGARVVVPPPLPAGWGGKSWACLHGARAARGEYLLFTDADTRHAPGGLARMLRFVREAGADLASALPYQRCETSWERGLALFHLALLATTAPFQAPRSGRVFAVGQYLLFRRAGYWEVGGHEAVRGALAEDLAFARLFARRPGGYRLLPETGVFSVRMYDSLTEFVRGWRRNLRLGLRDSRWSAPVEVALLFAAFAGLGPRSWPASLAAVAFLLLVRRRLGDFSWTSALFAPAAMALFTWITLLAVGDRLLGREVAWKGRSYPAAAA
jgi:glycosyltransferase involved in cell wall biosynthesis